MNMKKKALFILLMVALFTCIFALSVSAQGPKDLFSNVTILDDIGRTTTYGYGETDFSRVVLVDPDDSTKYYTYPAYYIFDIRYHDSEGNQPKPNFEALNTATGRDGTAKQKFDIKSIVCVELPQEFTGVSTNYTKTSEMINLEYIKFPKTFVIIHRYAFNKLSKLSLVEFESNTVQNAPGLIIDKYAFDNCDALVSVELPAHLKKLGERAFGDNDNLESVTFAPGTDFTIYNSDGTIQSNTLYAVFINDPKLKSISFPEGITSTGALACGNCSALEYVYIPASCKAFDDEAFYNCYALKTIEFAPNSQLQTIGKKAISESSAIESITFPNTFISAGGEAPIRNLTNLTYINFGASFTGFTGYASMYSTNNKNLVIVLPATFDVADKGELSSNATILYTGTKEQAEQFGRSKVQSYAEWLADGSPKNDSRIVYGYNKCEAFYSGEHDYTFDGSYQNDCVSKCGRCQEIVQNKNPNHKLNTVITYANGFLAQGLKVCDCVNADCGYHSEASVNALITFAGISIREKVYGICVGYVIDQDAISEYTSLGNTFRYGVVGCVPSNKTDVDPVNNSIAPVDKAHTVFAELSAEYSAVDFVIVGFDSHKDLEIAMCAFVYDGTEVSYINAEIRSDNKVTVTQDETIKTNTYNKVISAISALK